MCDGLFYYIMPKLNTKNYPAANQGMGENMTIEVNQGYLTYTYDSQLD